MRRGTELEPKIRLLFQQMTGIRVHPVCAISDIYPWMKVSLDGLSEDGTIAIEIKAPKNPKGHMSALAGHPPDYYKPQLQHQLLVGEGKIKKVVYCSYSDHEDFQPWEQLVLVDEWPDQEYMARLLRTEMTFAHELGWK